MKPIETDRLVTEMLGVISYAEQTLRLYPEKDEVIKRYLKSERVRLGEVVHKRDDSMNILERGIVW